MRVKAGLAVDINPAGSADRHLSSGLRSLPAIIRGSFFADGQGGRSDPKRAVALVGGRRTLPLPARAVAAE